MNGSCVIVNIAGTESKAKTTSTNSIVTSAASSGVAKIAIFPVANLPFLQ